MADIVIIMDSPEEPMDSTRADMEGRMTIDGQGTGGDFKVSGGSPKSNFDAVPDGKVELAPGLRV